MKSSSTKDNKKEVPKPIVKEEKPKAPKQEPPKQSNSPHGGGLQQPL